jgi:hypothetical protein
VPDPGYRGIANLVPGRGRGAIAEGRHASFELGGPTVVQRDSPAARRRYIDGMDENAAKPAGNPREHQFGLRSLFVATTLIAVRRPGWRQLG